MIRLSSGLRAAMLTDYGLAAMMRYGHIRLFSGLQPDTADAPEQGVLLGTITMNGLPPVPGDYDAGLQFQVDDNYHLVKSGNWQLCGRDFGDIGWWRMVWYDVDDGGQSRFLPRIDGAAGESLELETYSMAPEYQTAIDVFKLIFPDE